MNPKCISNLPQMNPKSNQNRPQINPKSIPNLSQIIPQIVTKTTPNRSQIYPKSSPKLSPKQPPNCHQNRTQNNPKLSPKQPKIELKSTQNQPEINLVPYGSLRWVQTLFAVTGNSLKRGFPSVSMDPDRGLLMCNVCPPPKKSTRNQPKIYQKSTLNRPLNPQIDPKSNHHLPIINSKSTRDLPEIYPKSTPKPPNRSQSESPSTHNHIPVDLQTEPVIAR